MKAHTGITDLIMIMVFIVAGVPLLLSLMRACNNSRFSYLDDKTVYNMYDSVEYVPVKDPDGHTSMVPTNLAPISLDYGGAQLIALIQDDYCPSDGTKVNWKLTADTPWGWNSTTGVVTPLTTSLSTNPTLQITKGWTAKRYNAFSAIHAGVSNPMKHVGGANTVKDDFYLVWDFESDCWMITHEFVNIFQER